MAAMTALSAERRAVIAILTFTVIWGCTFVWMKEAVAAIERELGQAALVPGVAVFLVLRFGLAAVVMVGCVPASRRGLRERRVWSGGLVLGGLLCGGFWLQMVGLAEVSPAVSAFLTSLYVAFTALLGVRTWRNLPLVPTTLGVILATVGAGYIGGPPELEFDLAEWLTVGCALLFAIHILATDAVTRKVAPLPVTVTSFVFVVAGSGIVYAWTAPGAGPSFDALSRLLSAPDFLRSLVLSSLLATVLAISLMNVYQQKLPPVRAAILYAIEPVWASILAVALGMTRLDGWLLFGGTTLLLGNVVVELGPRLGRLLRPGL